MDYKIPNKIKSQITKEFLISFKKDLNQTYKNIDNNHITYNFVEGTTGWNKVLVDNLKKFNLNETLSYYQKLGWEKSDLFDSELTKMVLSIE